MAMRPYYRDRLLSDKGNYVVIVPKNAPSVTPLFCPVCRITMRSRDDESAWESFNCCHDCSMKWAASRREEWLAGWRPTQEEIHAAVIERPKLVFSLNVG